MAKKFLNDIDLRGKLLINGLGGTDGYFLKTDGTGGISWAAGGGSSGFTGAGLNITNITGAASNSMTIKAATSGNGTLTLLPSGEGNINLNNSYTTRPAGSVSIVGQVPTGINGGHIYIQSAYAGSGAPGNIYIDGQLDEVSSRGSVYIGTGVDGPVSASGAVYLGTTGVPIYIDGNISNPLKVSGGSGAGTSGQFLKSNGTGGPPSWVTSSTVTSYTVLGSTTFSGTAPSFSSISASYKKLVMTITFSSIGTFSGALLFTAGTSSASAVPYVRWTTSSGTGVTNAGTSGMAISGTAAPVANLLYVVEIPNYTGNSVTCWASGGNNFAVGSVSAASTGIAYAAFTAGTSWGTAAGTATLYGVN